MYPPNLRPLAPLLLVALAACVRTVGSGPDFGDCAETPEGVYTFGQVGIGTCLSGPADLRFYERDGRTWLGVSNSNPFQLFTTGSLLSIAADSFDLSRSIVLTHELEAYALPIETYTGRLGVDGARGLAVLPSRLSADGYTTFDPDQAWLVDLSDPTSPTYVEGKRFVSVRSDPYEVVVDPTRGRAFVFNLGAESVSVVDLNSRPPELLDPAPASLITGVSYDDADGSGSTFELLPEVVVTTTNDQIGVTDAWTATWIEGTTRLWASTPLGLVRWSGSGSRYVQSGFGAELGLDLSATLTEITDPWISQGDANLVAHFADQGVILATETDGSAGGWGATGIQPVLTGNDDWNAWLGGPSLSVQGGRLLLFFDGRTEPGEPGAIGFATTADGATFNAQPEPLIEPVGELSDLAHPSVLVDERAGTYRMWLSALRDGRWTVALSESAVGTADWSTPEVVLDLPGEHAGAPYVLWSGGRYEMWLTVSEGGAWYHAHAWSWDGLTWSSPTLLLAPEISFDPARPPRAGVQADYTLAWRIEGENTGPLNVPVVSGVEQAFTAQGFSLQIATGHEVDSSVAGDLSSGGVAPGSVIEVDGWPTLYVTLTDAEGRQRLAALRKPADAWVPTAVDLIPRNVGGNVDGVSAPVAYRFDGKVHLLYSAVARGITTIRHAVSDDGLTFTPTDEPALTARPDFGSQDLHAGSVEPIEGGLRLWFDGSDGGTSRIGAAESTDGARFTPLTLGGRADQLREGEPGTFDDSGVSDPFVLEDGGVRYLWYTAFDGTFTSIGVATEQPDGTWSRRLAPLNDVADAVLYESLRTFAAASVRRPVAEQTPEGWVLWHAGSDGFTERIGRAVLRGDRAFPAYHFPTAGDRVQFVTRRGEAGRSEIRLDQFVDGQDLTPNGGALAPRAGVIDEARGLLFAVSGSSNFIVVIDVRDDSTATWTDLNYLDIEAAVRVPTTTNLAGYNDLVFGDGGLLYLSSQSPDAILLLDTSAVIDDERKDYHELTALASLPMHDLSDDAGQPTAGSLGAAGLALVPSQNLLLATHFRDNSLSVFDLSLGAHGEEIRYLSNIGENPHVVRVSPDERYAVIGLFQGDVYDGVSSSELAFLDLDPTSDTYLSIVSRIVNR